jgi:hypothetical protein
LNQQVLPTFFRPDGLPSSLSKLDSLKLFVDDLTWDDDDDIIAGVLDSKSSSSSSSTLGLAKEPMPKLLDKGKLLLLLLLPARAPAVEFKLLFVMGEYLLLEGEFVSSLWLFEDDDDELLLLLLL